MNFNQSGFIISFNSARKFILLGILFLCVSEIKADEFEVWTFAGAETAFKKMEFSIHSANFFLEEGEYFLNHTQVSLDFLSKRSISFGLAYKQEYVKFPDYWRTEYRPMLHLYYTKIIGAFELRDRSRWEFRFMDNEFINRYRNQIQLTYIKFNKIIPFLSTEFSFYFNKFDHTRQRTVVGAIVPISTVYLKLFMGHQANEDLPDEWSNKIMLGTGLSYSF